MSHHRRGVTVRGGDQGCAYTTVVPWSSSTHANAGSAFADDAPWSGLVEQLDRAALVDVTDERTLASPNEPFRERAPSLTIGAHLRTQDASGTQLLAEIPG